MPKGSSADPARSVRLWAVERLVDLHAPSPSAELPAAVEGQDFLAVTAALLAQLRTRWRVLVGMIANDTEMASPESVYRFLRLRSAPQYLIDDFRGTAAEGLVDPRRSLSWTGI